MSTGTRPPPIGDITTFTAQLDGLRVDQDPNDLSNALRAAFNEPELYDRYISSLGKDTERVKALLEVFDKALQATTCDVVIIKRVRQLCGWTGLLPTSYTIPEGLIRTTEDRVAGGGFGDVWEGIYDERRVAIKALRVYKGGEIQKVRKVFCKEVVIWRRISHPNIVPFLGVSEAPTPLCMVSEWMPNGNVREYIGKYPEASRLQLLLDISLGLSFLHSLEIVHGDLKGDNVLVDMPGRARLGDFGFTNIASLNCAETSSPRFRGSYQWMAPELFNTGSGKSGLSTQGSDTFALGMIAFEVFTGHLPFPENTVWGTVMKKIIAGERPSRPSRGKELGLSDELWELVRFSLAQEVEERPPASAFVGFLEKATPDIAALEELIEFDENSEEHIQKIHQLFGYADNTLFGMREEGTLVVIEVLDRVLNSLLNDPTLRSRCLYGLQTVSARCGLLPKSYWISRDRIAGRSGASSSTSSTHRGLMDGGWVAIKTISPDYARNFAAFKRRLCTSGVIWKRLQHPNVVRFLGFGSDPPPFSLLYHWMSNGSLPDYVRENPDADKLGLLLDVARGLTYLHKYNLVHGNLTGHKILVDKDGVACISEYGLELVLRDEASPTSIPTNARWMAPEVLSASGGRVPPVDAGKATDVYSFAMVMFEILTGTTPFPNESNEEIVDKVTEGLRPDRPFDSPSHGISDELWKQIVVCWDQEPNERPTAPQVLRALGEAKHREPVIPVEGSDGGMVMKEWNWTESDHEESPPTTPLHHSKSDTHKGKGPGRRFGKKVGKYVRKIFNLPRRVPTTTTTETTPPEKLTPGTEMVDQREEDIIVREGRVPYVVSQPIPEGKVLRKVVITTVSKDQGWSSHLEDYGTYRNSWTWFELSVGSPAQGSPEKWSGMVVRNVLAHHSFKEHTIEMSDGVLYEKAESGDVLTVWALAKFPGSTNMVKKVTIRYVVG